MDVNIFCKILVQSLSTAALQAANASNRTKAAWQRKQQFYMKIKNTFPEAPVTIRIRSRLQAESLYPVPLFEREESYRLAFWYDLFNADVFVSHNATLRHDVDLRSVWESQSPPYRLMKAQSLGICM